MRIEDVLPDLRTGKTAVLSELPGNVFTFEAGKLFITAEKVKKEFTALENYLDSTGWSIVDFPVETISITLTDLKAAWATLITPDSPFAEPNTSAKFIAFTKALGY